MLTVSTLRAALPTVTQVNADRFARPLAEACDEFGIDTLQRLAAFLPNAAHESGGFSRLVENLNYSSAGLLGTWPKRFTPETAAKYARHPERIANFVYQLRMGNGAEASGDGWRYRGRGLFQVTGHDNYAACGKALGLDLITSPELLEQPGPAARSAAWFWSVNGLNAYADRGDFDGVCDIINRGKKTAVEGDSIGWQERKTHYNQALAALQSKTMIV